MKIGTNQNIKGIAICFIVSFILVLYAYLYKEAKNTIALSVEYALEETIKRETSERYKTEFKKIEEMIKSKMDVGEKVADQITRKYMFVKYRSSDSYICDEMLAIVQPLHPDTLNVLLQEALQNYDVEIPTGIVYRDNRQIQYSGNDSTVFQRSFIHWGKSQSLDAKNELAVQAWINMAPWQVLRNMQADILWGVLFLIVGLGIIFMPWEKKASAKVSMGGLLLDKEARKVTIEGRECLLRNLEFRLLLMFVEKENHILSRDEIKTSLWNETVGLDNRVNNLLSTLRKALKDFPEYQITLEGEDRYVLSMPAKVDS